MAVVMKRGDLRPYLFAVLEKPTVPVPDPANPAHWAPLDEIALATVINFVMRRKGENEVVQKAPCTILVAAEGTIEYQWQPGDTDDAGEFEYEFEITWPNAEPQTIPRDSYFDLTIVPDIG